MCTGTEIRTYGEGPDGYPRCCPWETWNEATYRAQIGESTWRYSIEDFVKKNLWWLTREGLDNAAWDAQPALGTSLTYSESLVREAEDAITNLNDIYQSERWVDTPNGKEMSKECGNPDAERRWHAMVVRVGGPPDMARWKAAMRRVLPSSEAEALIAAQESGTSLLGHPFFSKALQLFEKVPRFTGQAYDRANNLVGWSKQLQPAASSFTVEWQADGTAKPRQWARDIIDHFKSRSSRAFSAARATASVARVVRARSVATPTPVIQETLSAKNMPVFSPASGAKQVKAGGVSVGTGMLLATASIGAVAVAYLVVRNRRRSRGR